jgi:hypothetical protein
VIRRVLVSFTLLLAAGSAQAQIIGREQQRFSREPMGWVSLGIGWMQQQGFNDPETGDGWDWGSAPQWRAAVELPAGRGASFGVVGTLARVPLIYDGSSCSRCDADANVSQLLGLFRIGGSGRGQTGLHQVIDLQAGVTMFSNIRQAETGTRLGSGKMSNAFSFGVGYGFGYAISPRTEFTLVQDWGLILLKRLEGTSQTTSQQTATRIGVRFGLGDR